MTDYACADCGTESIEHCEGHTCTTCGRGIVERKAEPDPFGGWLDTWPTEEGRL
jgi:predicted RNA-binding Zn-ribbon protein involved in translation (DUF1610 family)